ncbi:MAG: hypothetical protein JNM94_15650 [Phycisphaerae bacterium]|nr:hypothetical protein [Phycisphaerae bacterium]
MTAPQKKKRPLLRILLVLVLLVVVLVAAAPTILSFGPAASIARGAIADAVNGDVQVRGVSLGWFSSQSVDGLSIRDASGSNAIDVNVTVHNGLLSLITSGGSAIDASLSGAAKGTLEPDGTTGLAKLFDKPATTTGGGAGGGAGAGGDSGGGIPSNLRATLNIERFALALKETATGREYAIDGLKGSASVDGGTGTVNAQLDGDTNLLGSKGTMSLKADLTNVKGKVDLAAIGANVAFDAKNVRVPVDDRTADFANVSLNVQSPALGQTVHVTAKADGSLDGTTASSLAADLTLDKMIGSGGKVSTEIAQILAGVKGSVVATKLPTSLAQPALAATDVMLPKDLGSTIDILEIKAPGGGTSPITVELKAPKAQLNASAVVAADGSISNGNLSGIVEASPETLERVAKTTVAENVRLAISGRELRWAPPAAGASALSTFVGTIDAQPLAPATWKDTERGLSVALGSGGRVAFGRAAVTDPFRAEASLALGFGGATGATPPSAPNLVAQALVTSAFDRVSDVRATLDATFDPAFLAAATKQTFTKPVPVRVEIKDLDTTLPPQGAAGLAIDAMVSVPGENALYVTDLSRDIRFGDLVATLTSADAAKGAQLSVAGKIDRGEVDVKQTLGPLPTDFAKLDPFAIDTRGTVRISGLDGAALVPWAPEQKAVIEAAAIRGLSIDMRNEPLPGRPGQRVVATLGGEPLKGEIVVGVERTQARIDKLDLDGILGKDLVAALQKDSASKVRLADDAPFSLELGNPVTLVFDELKRGVLPSGLAAKLTVPQLIVSSAPGIASALALRDFSSTLSVEANGNAARTQGSFSASGTTSAADRIDRGTFDLAWAKKEGPSLLRGLSGDVKLSGISVPWVETLLGKDKGSLSTWTGDNGDLALTMATSAQGESVRLVPAFPRVAGTVDVLTQGKLVEAKTNGLSVRIDQDALTKLAVRPSADPTRETRYTFPNEFVAQLTAGTVRIPNALTDGAMSFAGASVDVALETQPLPIGVTVPGKAPGRLDMPAIVARANSSDLGKGLEFNVTDRGTAPGAGPSPAISIKGNVEKLLGANGAFDASNAVANLDANVKGLPSVFVDLVGATGGTVSRGLGETIDLTAKGQGLSSKGGQLSAKLVAPYAEVDVPQFFVKDGVATVLPEKPITGSLELSPGMKDDILYVINPVFADIDLAQKRATLKVADLSYPLDGPKSGINANFSLDVGDIKFKNGAPLSTVMSLTSSKPDNLEGRIEPLNVNIKNGLLTYKDFGLRFGRIEGGWKTQFDMQGSIDLTKKPIYVNEITTKIPASQIGNWSSAVRGWFDKIGGAESDLAKTLSIGVKMYGPLFDSQGNRIPLEKTAAPPDVGDLLKQNPEDLIKQGIDIFEKIKKKN